MIAGCEPGNAPRLLDAFREVLGGVAEDGPQEEDFASAVRRAIVETVREAETPLDRAIAVATQRILSDQAWDAELEIDALAAVTPGQVAETARELSGSLITVVRPEQQ